MSASIRSQPPPASSRRGPCARRGRQRLLALLALSGLLAMPAGASEPALTLFSSAAAGGPPPAPWRVVTLPGTSKPLTRFELVELDGLPVLRVQTDKSYGNLIHPWKTGARSLQWRWRLERPNVHANLHTRDGDDVALKLCVLFDMPTDRLSAGERAQLAVARALSREAVPAATLCYVWDHSLPVGTVLPNAFTQRLRYLVVDSGEAQLHQWLGHQRDLAADFALVFGAESEQLPTVSAIGVGADADNTGDSSLGYVGDMYLLP